MIPKGATIKTSYGTGPYTVISRSCVCNCTEPLDSINGSTAPSKDHYHYVCRGKDGSEYYLGGYDDQNKSVWSKDEIIVISMGQVQLELF